jgi:anaerobic ribonucleoside-triphosphate reductase activating protein
MNVRLARIAYPVTSLGPGHRVALWVAGCSMRCHGCITPDLWNPDAGRLVSVERVLGRILALDPTLDGISISGGEPFDQAAALGYLLQELRTARPQWNTLVFSGYTFSALVRGGAAVDSLLTQADVLVAGPYDRRKPGVHPLAASANQTVHFLTERGKALRSRIDSAPLNGTDLALGRDGDALLVGIVAPDARSRIHATLGLSAPSTPERQT